MVGSFVLEIGNLTVSKHTHEYSKTHLIYYHTLTIQFTKIISGGALGVDLEAEKLARYYCLRVEVLVPPCHPRSQTVPPLTSTELAEAIPTTKQVAARLNRQ